MSSKTSSHRCRTPRFLWVSPVYSRQKAPELRGGDCHNPVGRTWPQKTPSFQTLREQARALAIVPDYFQKVAAPPAKAKQMTAQRIAVKNFLNLERQARKASPHIGVAGRQPNPNAARESNHRRRSCLASSPITRDSVASSGAPSIVRRTLAPNAIVIVPWLTSEDERSAAGALTVTGTNAGRSVSSGQLLPPSIQKTSADAGATRDVRCVGVRLVQRQNPARLLGACPISTLFF